MNPELLARWTKTRSSVELAGFAGVLIALFFMTIGLRFVIIAWPLPIKPAIVGISIFVASLVLTPSIHLLRQGRAIRRAALLKNEAAFAEVLLQQHRYWSYLGVMLVTILLLAGLAAATAAFL